MRKLSSCVFALLSLLMLFPSIVNALSTDQVDVLNSGVYYFNTEGDGTNSTGSSSCSGGSSGSLDQLLQAIAFHESGGNPLAHNSSGGAYGKYQYIDSTWQNAVKSYYPTPQALATIHASDASEAVQDAVTYYRFAALSSKYNGDVWKMAVVQYYPAALDNLAYWIDRVPAPEAGNTQTIRQFANQIVDWINNGDGKNIKLTYQQAPEFNRWLQQDGLTNIPQLYAADNDGQAAPLGSTSTNSFSCGGSSAIVQTALNLAWPDSSHGGTPKPEYKTAIDTYNPGEPPDDCGVFVATVMRASGADPNYPASGTAAQGAYVKSSSKYQILPAVTSLSDLAPGDILIIPGQGGDAASGHTFIYLGQQGQYNEASASYPDRAANLGVAQLQDSRGSYLRARLIQ